MKTRIAALARPALTIGLAVLVITAAACGSDNSDSNASGTSGSAGSNAAVDTTGAITIVAKDNFFDPKSFTGPGGQDITVTLDNQGAAIHDFVIKDQKGPDGKELQTGLITTGNTGTVQFSLPAGEYDFYCAVHPVEMRGTFTLR